MAGQPSGGFPVVVNVYDLSPHNKYLHVFGLGFYHTGIEVQGREYTFNDEGVIAHPPRAVPGFRESIILGYLNPREDEVSTIIRSLRNDFRPVCECLYIELHESCGHFLEAFLFSPTLRRVVFFIQGEYHVVANNCNDFSDALCRSMIEKGLPGWINRMANCAGCLSAKKMPLSGVVPEQKVKSGQTTSRGDRHSSSTDGQISKEKKQLTAKQIKLMEKLRQSRAAVKQKKRQ